eukprot:g4147.t1
MSRRDRDWQRRRERGGRYKDYNRRSRSRSRERYRNRRPQRSSANEVEVIIEVGPHAGSIIGRSGQTIRKLGEDSGAKIKIIDRAMKRSVDAETGNEYEEEDAFCRISGCMDSVAKAKLAVETILASEKGRPSKRRRIIGESNGKEGRDRGRNFSNDVSSNRQVGNKEELERKEMKPKKELPNFGLSGALAKDERTGNTLNGVTLKWSEPPEARLPSRRWRLYEFKGEEQLSTLHLHRQSAYLIGRDSRVADIHCLHASISGQHAVFQFRQVNRISRRDIVQRPGENLVVKPYLMDLQSTHGTFVNGNKIDSARYFELREADVLKFGASTREYVLLHGESKLKT